MSSDAPILGRRNVAAAFGVSPSTLRRWLNDAEIEQRYRLRDVTFRIGARWATTERLRARFIEHMQSIDPREVALREVAETVEQFRRRA
jgi:transposase-like protein